MIALLISIITSSFIFVIFKLFEKYQIDTFQAIVYNYFAALICGLTFFGHEWNPISLEEPSWIPGVILCALLFISLFVLMGISSQKNGIAATSVAVKMSMALSVGAMLCLYKEPLSALKIAGIILAITGVILVSIEQQPKESTSKKYVWMLAVLFTGSALLDVALNYSQHFLLGALSPSLFSAFGFGLAGLFGSVILGVRFRNKTTIFSLRHVIAGIILGIPNFFSIYLLLLAYETAPISDSSIVTIINISVVCLSTLFGYFLFKEKLSPQKWLGISAAILAIILISQS